MKLTKEITLTVPKQEKVNNKNTVSVQKLAQDIADVMDNLVAEKFYKKFIHIRQLVTNAFYKDYYPLYYERHNYAIKYMMYPYIQNYEFCFELGVDTPIYRAWHKRTTEEYLYMNSFIGGYHGGYTHGSGHPKPGVPFWRTPVPSFERWGRPAKRMDTPPYEMLMRLWEEFLNSEGQEIRQKCLQWTLNMYKNEISACIRQMINGGD